MHSYSTPMAPFVKEVIEFIAKFFVGEEYELGSDYVLKRASSTSGHESNGNDSASNMKDYLKGRSFFRRDGELD